jgi:hypothetical protein
MLRRQHVCNYHRIYTGVKKFKESAYLGIGLVINLGDLNRHPKYKSHLPLYSSCEAVDHKISNTRKVTARNSILVVLRDLVRIKKSRLYMDIYRLVIS